MLNLLKLFLSDFCSKDGLETPGTWAKAIVSAKLLPEITEAKNKGPGRGPGSLFSFSRWRAGDPEKVKMASLKP